METKVIIKEKAEAYDKVVNKLKGFMAQGVDPLITRANIQDFFPELKKSEDEQIREKIIDFLMLPHPQFVGKRDHKIWIAWLEKQGEKKPWSEEDNFMYNRIKNLLTDISLAPESINSLSDWLKDLKDRVQPQTTWKPSNEQMKALDIAIRSGIQLGSWEEKALRELRKQLKAL